MQLWTFSFSSYFLDQSDNGCIVATTCSWLYLINKSCVWTEYIILTFVNVNCLTRKTKLNIPLIVNFVCSRHLVPHRVSGSFFVKERILPSERKRSTNPVQGSLTVLPKLLEGRGWWARGGEPGTNYRGPTVLHMFLSFSAVSLFVDLQINPFITSPSYSATDSQSFRFSVNIFSRPTVRGGDFPPNRGPNPLSTALFLN
jgi:hypothetical protein